MTFILLGFVYNCMYTLMYTSYNAHITLIYYPSYRFNLPLVPSSPLSFCWTCWPMTTRT